MLQHWNSSLKYKMVKPLNIKSIINSTINTSSERRKEWDNPLNHQTKGINLSGPTVATGLIDLKAFNEEIAPHLISLNGQTHTYALSVDPSKKSFEKFKEARTKYFESLARETADFLED